MQGTKGRGAAARETSRIHDESRSTRREIGYRGELGGYFEGSVGSTVERLENFAKYVPRQNLTRFLARVELLRQVLEVQGSIVECGVYLGGGLMSFAQASAILEPLNYQRKIIGFDTFAGLAGVGEKDARASSQHAREGGLAVDAEADILKSIDLFDRNRMLSHIDKVRVVKGDLRETLPRYLDEQPHTVVSLLYLDLDVYEPTRAAIEALRPRMPRGSIIAFDELNLENWPGETLAVMDTLGLADLAIRRFTWDPTLSWAVL